MPKKDPIITSIDIGTSKISMVTGRLNATNTIDILGKSTVILNGMTQGQIDDPDVFFDAFQNGLNRLQAVTSLPVTDVLINIPNYQSKLVVQTGIADRPTTESMAACCNRAMRRATQCVDQHHHSILHIYPIRHRIHHPLSNENGHVEVDTGIVLCDRINLTIILNTVHSLKLRIRGIINDYLTMPTLIPHPVSTTAPFMMVDIGAQLTSYCVIDDRCVIAAKTIPFGSQAITLNLAKQLHCSYSEAERVKVLHGSLMPHDTPLIPVHCNDGPHYYPLSHVSSIIEQWGNHIMGIITADPQIHRIHTVYLLGGGAYINGLCEWITHHHHPSWSVQLCASPTNQNDQIAIAQLMYSHQQRIVIPPKKKWPHRIWDMCRFIRYSSPPFRSNINVFS